MINHLNNTPRSWLAFELNVLRRLKFGSVCIPFTGEPALGSYLKRWDIRVLSNDPLQSSWTKAFACIQNNADRLSAEELNIVLEDAYVPRYRLQNEQLIKWFSEVDAWWFDNVRGNIERLETPMSQAIALTIGMSVGDYVLSFDRETLELRQPLSTVFKRLWSVLPEPFINGQNNPCTNKPAHEFIAETYTDLLFLRLPAAHGENLRSHLGWKSWRDEWIRYGDSFWGDVERSQLGRLGYFVETKNQYLRLVEDALRTAAHIPSWAIAHIEDGFITTQDIVETIQKVRRRVDTVFTKDFSELTGTKAVIITA